MMRLRIILALALVCGCPTAIANAANVCADSAEANRQMVLAFYDEALVSGRRPEAAFARYMSEDFVEHKPDIAHGTRAAAGAFLAGLIRDVPTARWEVLRTVAERDHVFLHARFTPAPGAPPYAIADLFRVKGCRIVEHWDVVAGPPKDAPNPNSRF